MAIFPEYIIEAVNNEKKKNASSLSMNRKKKKIAGSVRGGGSSDDDNNMSSPLNQQQRVQRQNNEEGLHHYTAKAKQVKGKKATSRHCHSKRRGGRNKNMIWSDQVIGVCQSIMKWLLFL